MKVDFDELKEVGESAAETAEVVEETTEASGGLNTEPLEELKKSIQLQKELQEMLAPEDDGSSMGDALVEMMKDDEIRMGVKHLVSKLKESAEKPQDNVKRSPPNEKPVDVEPKNVDPNTIQMTPDELFNFTLEMIGNVNKVNSEMTVDQLQRYVQDNEDVIKMEMESL